MPTDDKRVSALEEAHRQHQLAMHAIERAHSTALTGAERDRWAVLAGAHATLFAGAVARAGLEPAPPTDLFYPREKL